MDSQNFAVTGDQAAAHRSADPGPIERLFFEGGTRDVHKWVHYLPIYDRHFAPYRHTAPTMLEIGVFRGGSIEMWRKYFGPSARICGIDINPACADLVEAPNMVRIGSQDDPAFLQSVLDEIGAPDIIIDDGSHVAGHQLASFRSLFGPLKDGGLYVIEDMHTAYWPDFDGGMRRPLTAIELVKLLIDDQHAWYHAEPELWVAKDMIGGIHVYDSIAIIEKKKRLPPADLLIPGKLSGER